MKNNELLIIKRKVISFCNDCKSGDLADLIDLIMQLQNIVSVKKAYNKELKEKSLFTRFFVFITGSDEDLKNRILSDDLEFQILMIEVLKCILHWMRVLRKDQRLLKSELEIIKKDNFQIKKVVSMHSDVLEKLELDYWGREVIPNTRYSGGDNKYNGQYYRDIKPDLLKLSCIINEFYRETNGDLDSKRLSGLATACNNVFSNGIGPVDDVLRKTIKVGYHLKNKEIFKRLTYKIDCNLDLFDIQTIKPYYFSALMDSHLEKDILQDKEIIKDCTIESLCVDFLYGLQMIHAGHMYKQAIECIKLNDFGTAAQIFWRLTKNADYCDRAYAFLGILYHEIFNKYYEAVNWPRGTDENHQEIPDEIIEENRKRFSEVIKSADQYCKDCLSLGVSHNGHFCTILYDLWMSTGLNVSKYVAEFTKNPIDDEDILTNFVKGLCFEYMKKDKSLPKGERKEYKLLSRDSFDTIKVKFLFAFIHRYNRSNDFFADKEEWDSFDTTRNWFDLTLQDINKNDRKLLKPFFF